jgi:IS5 family transposase
LPGNPDDGHTLGIVLPGIKAITGAALSRILADAGYKGHNAPSDLKVKVYAQGQKRGVIPQPKTAKIN